MDVQSSMQEDGTRSMTLEPEDIPAFLVVIASILAAVFLLAFLAPRVPWPFRPTPDEVGHAAVYTVRVGAVMGSTLLSAPFVRVTTYEDFVVIAPALSSPHVLRRGDEVRVEREELRGRCLGCTRCTSSSGTPCRACRTTCG